MRALVKAAKSKSNVSSRRTTKLAQNRKSKTKSVASRSRKSAVDSAAGTRRRGATNGKTSLGKRKNTRVLGRIRKIHTERENMKDLSYVATTKTAQRGGAARKSASCAKALAKAPGKDRVVLLVRDPYWLQACWDVTRQCVQRASAAMAEHWHTAVPILRLFHVDTGATTSTAEQVVRDIPVHGGVKNWYIEIKESPKSYRVDLGYRAENGRFFVLARSNVVMPPQPGSSDAIDENWTDIAENYEKIYALSGGYLPSSAGGDLQQLFEERLRRPMGSPLTTQFGAGADQVLRRDHDFSFQVDAEMIIYGATKPDAHVTLAGEPVRLRQDGTFTVRMAMANRRQVLPVVASSRDGVEQRTVVIAVERNTKVMEPMIRESHE